MYDIKELVWEEHKNAERQEFVKTLMSGKIDESLYATYLYNQLQCYSALEKYARAGNLFMQTPNLPRAEWIYFDYKSLWPNLDNPPFVTDSTKEYVKHIDTIQDDNEKLYAHIYVRHLGDLSGGQMIATKTPGPNKYYKEFKHLNIKEYKITVKEMINGYLNTYRVNVIQEAKTCFAYATRLFQEMNDLGKTS